MVQVEPWSPMNVGDKLELFWGAPDPDSPDYPGMAVANKTLQFPDELNKAVLLSVPEEDVYAGWFNVACRVTRVGTGFQELSPLLRVLVKLDRPGGIDPAPDVNPNLAAPILPPEVIRDGVDTTWAARGVPVTIEPYVNMAVGDRIRLNWGGAFVEYTLKDDSEVNQPVTLIVDDATIRAAGDGDALALRYQVFDVVHNRSGWSPTTEVMVNVQGNALFLPEVTNADDNGVIDLTLLGSEDVRVLVTAFEPDFAVGDTVTLSWLGHTAEGVSVPYEEAQQVTRSPVQTLEFFVPNANVVALAQGDAVVSYRLQSGRSSKQVRVTIVGEAIALSPPTVDEAPNDYDELDASLSRATVRIPPYPGMEVGDTVTLIWSGTRADGQPHLYQVERQISGSAVNKEIVLQIPGAEIALLAGGTVELWYEVITGDGTPLRPSQVRTLRVSQGQGILLPAATVDEAPDNVTLDPAAVDLYATVRIAPYTGMAIGDRVDMYWIGSGANGSTSDWITIRAATLNKPVVFDVDKAYVDANDGGTVTVRYTVTPTVGRPPLTTPLTLRVAKQGLMPPAVKETGGSANLDPLNVVDRLTVVVPTYAGWLPTDEVSVTWIGTSSYTTPAQTLDSSREVALPVSLIAYNLGREVQVTYTVIRNGVSFDSSMPLVLSVLLISESALADSGPQILQAANAEDGGGVLNLNAVTGGATIRVYVWPHIALGQPLWLRLHGKNADGSNRSLTIWQAPGPKVSQIWLDQGYYDVTVPYSYLGGLMWASELSMEFKVGFDQSLDEDDATFFPIRTYVVDNWKDSITTFADGTMGNWVRGPAFTQGTVTSGVFRNPTTAVSGHAGVVLKQTLMFLAGRRYRVGFKIRAYLTTGVLKPNFSADIPGLGEIMPASDVPLDQKWYAREGYFSVPSSGSYELDLVSHQDRGGGSGADGGNDYELDDIVVTLADDNWKDSITTFSDATLGKWEPGTAYTQGRFNTDLGVFQNPTTAASGHAGVVLKQSFIFLAGMVYRFSFKIRAYVTTSALKPNFSVSGPVLGEIIPALDVALDQKWYLREGYFTVPSSGTYEIDLVSHQDRGGGAGSDGGNDYELDAVAVTLAVNSVDNITMLAAPVVTEADPFTDTLNLVKPVNDVHIVVDYAGMAIDDVVTMVWEGTAGGGSTSQTVEIKTLGPVVFTVGSSTIVPNYNKTVEIYYTVQRANRPGAFAEVSALVELAIQNPTLQGNATFVVGTTSFYRCTARSSITIPDDLPVGTVIETTSTSSASAQTSFTCSTSSSSYRVNLVGSQPKNDAMLFPTGISGLGFRLVYQGKPLTAGPGLQNAGTYGNGGTTGAIEFVKTGSIAPGATLSAGVLAQWLMGSNRLYDMGWQLMNDVAIDVVRRRSVKGKRQAATAPMKG